MRHARPVVLAALALLAFALVTGSATAAHLGNNMAETSGSGDPDANGQAIVNYSDGTGLFNGRITVQNLEPGGTYTFLVRRANGTEVSICSGEANDQGAFG